jgi:hypothetical protein
MSEREELIAEIEADESLTPEDRNEILAGFDCHHFEDLLRQDD